MAGGTEAFFAAMQDCYLRFFPGTEPGFRAPTVDELPPAYPELDDAAPFGPVQRRRHTWEVDYSADRFRALLSTYSNHIDLPTWRRDGLLDCIAGLIAARFGGTITKRYLAELVVVRAF